MKKMKKRIFLVLSGLLMILAVSSVSSAAAAEGKKVTYQVNGATYEGYYAEAAAGAPLVLIIHDWDGLNDYEIKRAEMLAGMGYTAFAADLFGKGVTAETTEQRKQLTGALYKDRAKMRSLLNGALKAAQEQGADIGNAVAMGYCFGGGAVLEMARSGAGLKGYVSFHGTLKTPEGQDYSKTKGNLLILHGTADQSVSMADFAQLATEMESQGVAHEMITYSGAPHAFTVFGSDRYREDADRKSWARFTRFLTETVKQ